MVVIDPIEPKLGARLERAGGVQSCCRLDPHHVLLRWHNRAGSQRVAVWPAHQVALVAFVRRQKIFGVLGRWVHQYMFTFLQFHPDNRMIERRLRHFGISLGTDVHQHRVSLEPSRLQHRHQQRRFVAANPIFVVESQLHVMRLEPWPVLLRGQAHIPDFLRHVIKHCLDLIQIGLCFRGKLIHRFLHLRRGRLQMRFAHVPVPFRHRLPIRRRADQQTLQDCFIGRHRWFIEHARHVIHFPTVQCPLVLSRLRRMLDCSRDLVFQNDPLQRLLRWRINLI